ncbi:MAG: hypothetical protein KF764_35345 [Labilithrix sp.]|nr:hypothetical protein [Labilithrix sp.]
MKSVRQKNVDLRSLKLSAEEGFVLSRVDGVTTVRELVALTGLDEGRVIDIVDRLHGEGVVEVDERPAAPPAASSAAPPAAPREPTPAPAAERGSDDGAPGIDDALLAFLRGDSEPEAASASDGASPHVEAEARAAGDDDRAAARELEAAARAEAEEAARAGEQETGAELEAAETAGEAPDEASTEAPPDPEHEARTEREYRKIYETIYHPMQRDERVARAREVTGAHLLALCLDADPQVIHAALSNPRVTFECARLVATHHRTHIGLEHVAKRSDFLADALVQRRLLRNPQLPGTILNRMVSPKLMMDVYKIAVDREIPERSRVMTRDMLRKKFMLSSADERAALLFKTEGRCLVLLVNCSLDAHSTQILCGKNSYTILFIQNLARWSATPPQLLAHLLKMPVVRRNLGLRKMLLKHPNTPSDVKRSSQS